MNHKLKKGLSWSGCMLMAIGILMTMFSCMSKRPVNIGVQNGKLINCPASPNCVCSFEENTDKEHYIEPLTFSSPIKEVKNKIKDALSGIPRTKIINETESYIYAECTSMLFRFVDDLEILIDEENKLIHFRSASRVGHSDLGVNRKRVEKLKDSLKNL